MTSLTKRIASALKELGSDERLAPMLRRALRRRGVTMVTDDHDRCRCFPRTKAPRQEDSIWVCQLCKKQVDSEFDKRALGGSGFLVLPAEPE